MNDIGRLPVPGLDGSTRIGAVPRPRSITAAGVLTILFGAVGALSGLAGAGTFIPYRNASTFNPSFAELFTAISVIAVFTSILGMISGWGALRRKAWAWRFSVGTGAANVALVAAMTAFWPEFLPFLVIVGMAYGLVILFLLVGHGSYAAVVAAGPAGRPQPAPRMG